MPFETPPGRQLQIDFGERRVSIGGEMVPPPPASRHPVATSFCVDFLTMDRDMLGSDPEVAEEDSMSKRMSRRAVLRAIGIAPAILAAANLEARAEAQEQAANLVEGLWTQALLADLDEVEKKGAEAYRKHHKRDWTPNERKRYRRVGQNLYAFYLAGIRYVSEREADGRLVTPPRFMVTAWDYGRTDSGFKVVVNLVHFTGVHGPVDIETEICAWRCGKLAAEKELAADASATVVTAPRYEAAWLEIKADVATLREQLARSKPEIRMTGGGGGC